MSAAQPASTRLSVCQELAQGTTRHQWVLEGRHCMHVQRKGSHTRSANTHAQHPKQAAFRQHFSPCQGQQKRRHVCSPAVDFSVLASTPPALPDIACIVAAALGARVWTKLFDVLVKQGVLEQKLSRKLVHATTGPIFLLTWPLFSVSPWAPVLAASVPALNAVRLAAVGVGLAKDEGLVSSVSRSGDSSELLKGPLYYCLVLIVATVLFWRDDPSGLVAISLMCGGDGLADIVGRRWGKGNSLPHNPAKSWAGSAAMLLAGTAMSFVLISMYSWLGYLENYSASVLLPSLLAISLLATVVESLPINQVLDDNISVPVVAAAATAALLPHAAHAANVALLI